MQNVRQQHLIGELQALIGRLDGQSRPERGVIPFGLGAIDAHLQGGLAQGALHEVVGQGHDLSFGAAPALFIAGILARLEGPVLWCVRRRDLFAPGLAGAGLHPGRVLYVEAGDTKTVLAVVEEALKHRALAGVVGEIDALGLTPSRRLQLAAEAADVPAFVLRRWRRTQDADKAGPTAAMTRWRVGALPSVPLASAGIGRARWQLDLLRCRGATPSSWIVEACDAQGYLAPGDLPLSAELADGSPAAPEALRRAG